MPDIRNFFGNNKGGGSSKPAATPKPEPAQEPVVKAAVATAPSTPDDDEAPVASSSVTDASHKRKRLVVDDDDDEDIVPTAPSVTSVTPESKVVPESSSSAKSAPVEAVKPKPESNVKAEPIVAKSEAPVASIFTKSSTDDDVESDGIPKDLKDLITWKAGESIPFMALVDTFEEISKVSGRLEKESLFTRLFRSVIVTTPAELDAIVYLASNNVSPAYDGMELGIGDSILVKAVSQATGRNTDAVQEAYQREGDLGTVALMSRANQKTLSFAAKPKPLMAKYVLEQYRAITQIKGSNAQGRKVDIIKAMMVRCQGSEAKYIVRALQGKLRIGTAEQTVLVALAHAFSDTPTAAVKEIMKADKAAGRLKEGKASVDSDNEEEAKVEVEEGESSGDKKMDEESAVASEEQNLLDLLSKVRDHETAEALKLRVNERLDRTERYNAAEVAVKRAYSECPNLSMLVQGLLQKPLYELYKTCRLTIGVPVAPMLAKPTKEINEVLKRLSGQPFTMEYKYDGERAQVHLLEDGSVKIFSRNSEDNTGKYPDLLEVMKKACKDTVKSCIIDAEVVAYDREKGCLLPFQVLSTRKRKVDEGEEDNCKVKIILQAFDMLYVNGISLLRESLRTRRTILHSALQHAEGFFHFASGMDHVENGDTAPIETFLQEACASMCEGLMVKTLDSNATYEPSKRSLNWLKLKKDYIDGMGVCDSVDLVVLGGYLGRGKRVNTYGAYLMACYDPERDEYQSVCKVGTGFKDEDLARLYEQMKSHIIPSKRKPVNYNVGEPLYPDDWFEAAVVWELQAADLSKSSVHKGGIGRLDGAAGRGIGLRFPRYLRDRPDKKPENATAAEQIVDMFYSQGGVGENGNGDGGDNDEDDFDGI